MDETERLEQEIRRARDFLADLAQEANQIETYQAKQGASKMTDSEIVARIREYLNRPRMWRSDICSCASCLEKVEVAVREGWACEDCGYSGRPVAVSCQCYDEYALYCGSDSSGPGCPRGAVACPVCDTGEFIPIDAIKEIRRILDSGA